MRPVVTGLVVTGLVVLGLVVAGADPALALSTDPVPPELRKGRVLILRPNRVDVVRDGVVRRLLAVGPTAALEDLPRLVADPSYVTWSRPGVVRLSATIAQRPGSVLVGGPYARRLELDETGDIPVRLLGTRATLRLRGTSVAPAGATVPRYPVVGTVKYENRSTVALSDLAVTGLGDPAGRVPAVEVSSASVVTLRSVRIEGGGPGVRLTGVARARVSDVTVRATRGAGVAVSGGGAVTVQTLRVHENTGDGLRITGPVRALTVSDVVATANHRAGVIVLTQQGGTLTRLRTSHNLDHGLVLRAVSRATLDDVDSAWDARPLVVEAGSDTTVRRLRSQGTALVVSGSTRLRLDGVRLRRIPRAALTISGREVVVRDADVAEAEEGIVVGAGAIGVTGRPVNATEVTVAAGTFVGRRNAVRVTGSAHGTTLTGVTATAPQGVALQVSGPDTLVRAGIWSGATGLRVRDRATDVVVDGARVSSSGTALEVPATGVGSVTVSGTTLTGGGRKAVSSAAGRLTLRWTAVSGAALGVDLRGDGTLEDTQVSAGRQALRVVPGHRATLRRGRFLARDVGIEAAPGGSLLVSDSTVRASLASQGHVTFTAHNDLSPRPLRGLALAVAGMLLAALTLEGLRGLREPAGSRQVDAPAHVLNRS